MAPARERHYYIRLMPVDPLVYSGRHAGDGGLLVVFCGIRIVILGHFLLFSHIWWRGFRHIFNQLGHGNAKCLRYFIKRLERGIVLWIVPDRLDRFEINIGKPL